VLDIQFILQLKAAGVSHIKTPDLELTFAPELAKDPAPEKDDKKKSPPVVDAVDLALALTSSRRAY
jgi:hypothetical protein